MSTEWFSEWFNEDYALVYPHRDSGEAAQLLALYEANAEGVRGKAVLDACCGLGRMSFALNDADATVSAFDLSSYFISECKKNPAAQKVDFSVLDIRDMAWQNSFDGIFQIFTSFGYFESDAENLAIFEGIHAALKTGGFYLFDFLNAAHVRANLNPKSADSRGGADILQERKIEENRVVKTITINDSNSTRAYRESVALISPEQIRAKLLALGFDLIGEFGNYNGAAFHAADSARYIVLGRKK